MTEKEGKKKFDWDKHKVDIVRQGTQIILPSKPQNMPIPEARKALQRLEDDENQEIMCIEEVDAFPLDGAVAFMRTLQKIFGWVSPVPTPSFFGPQPPRMYGVKISKNETIQVPFGRFEIPTVDGYVNTAVNNEKFVITAKVKKRDAHIIKEIGDKTRALVREESIYRGHALHFFTNNDGKLDFETPPSFIDTDSVNREELILNAEVKEMVETSILTPIEFTDLCEEAKIPLNRGILLEGIYGVGKTMIAKLTAKVCEENGWTFLLLDKTEALSEGLLFAQKYSPAVVFVEDIDRATEDRDDDANDLLNTIDGILTKDAKVIAVMTTNHVERITEAMLRPGRLDSVITIPPPDAESVVKLIRLYSRDLLEEGESLEEAGVELSGQIPATIREVVERSKLRAIRRGSLKIKEPDLVHATREMAMHLALLNKEKNVEPSGGDLILQGFNKILKESESFEDVHNIVESVKKDTKHMVEHF